MNKFEEIIKKAKKTALSEEEKIGIRASLLEFIGKEATPARSPVFRFLRPAPVITSLLIVMMVGGGVSFASENALPGDILYPIKIKVNEEVRAALILSSEKKADWEARRAERRLEEAEKLVLRGKLTPEVKNKIENNFVNHAERVREKIARAESRADMKMLHQAAEAKIKNRVLKKLSNTEEKLRRLMDKKENPR